MKRFAFFYIMKDKPERVRETGPAHGRYWKELALPDYSGGPFADRSGGLITFLASGYAEAEKLVFHDPFVTAEVIAAQWLKEWSPE